MHHKRLEGNTRIDRKKEALSPVIHTLCVLSVVVWCCCSCISPDDWKEVTKVFLKQRWSFQSIKWAHHTEGKFASERLAVDFGCVK
jgi:hypothetical protein